MHAAVRVKNSYFCAQYIRIARHRGSNRAVVSVANSMPAVTWHLLTNCTLYEDPRADYYIKRHDPAIGAERQRRIESLGHEVTVSASVS